MKCLSLTISACKIVNDGCIGTTMLDLLMHKEGFAG